jgi:hypothetical protein
LRRGSTGWWCAACRCDRLAIDVLRPRATGFRGDQQNGDYQDRAERAASAAKIVQEDCENRRHRGVLRSGAALPASIPAQQALAIRKRAVNRL